VVLQALAQPAILVGQLAPLERALDRAQEALALDRLLDEVVGRPHASPRPRARSCRARSSSAPRSRGGSLELLENLDAVHARQQEVAEDDVGNSVGETRDRVLAASTARTA
jgi:hypothetical protein